MRHTLALTLLTALTISLVACGDDDADGPSTDATSNGATSNGTTDATSNGTTGGGWDLGFPCRQLPMGEDGWIYVYGLRDLDGDLEPETVGRVDAVGFDGAYVVVIYDETGRVPVHLVSIDSNQNGAATGARLAPIGDPLDVPIDLGGSLPMMPEGLVVLSYSRVEVVETLGEPGGWSLDEAPAPAEDTNNMWGCGWEGQ